MLTPIVTAFWVAIRRVALQHAQIFAVDLRQFIPVVSLLHPDVVPVMHDIPILFNNLPCLLIPCSRKFEKTNAVFHLNTLLQLRELPIFI